MNYGHGYDAHIVRSDDYGRTWSPDIRDITEPMFPGREFGAPALVNFYMGHYKLVFQKTNYFQALGNSTIITGMTLLLLIFFLLWRDMRSAGREKDRLIGFTSS